MLQQRTNVGAPRWRARFIPPAALLAVSFTSTTALAHDFNPPAFRGQPGTTFQAWEFGTPALGAPDGECPSNNPNGAPTATGSNNAWLAQFAGLQGVQCLTVLGGALNFNIPNTPNPIFFKTVWVQVTFHPHGGTNVGINVTPLPISVSPAVDLPVPGKPGWIQRTISFCIFGCPGAERVTLTALGPLPPPDLHVDIDQVIIDTNCFPDGCQDPSPPMFPGDYDGDGMPDFCDNAPGISNPNQLDCDGDFVGNPSDLWGICPPGTPAESEPCGPVAINDGCTMPAPAFEPISCNDEKCGTLWAEAGVLDNDWYEIDVPDTDGDGVADLSIEICTAIPLHFGILNNDCANLIGFGGGMASADQLGIASVCVPAPATYWIQLFPGDINGPIFDGFPCNSVNEYRLKVFCTEACITCTGGAPQGHCCQAHPLAGCDDVECCANVCEIDPFCCNNMWDNICANQAGVLCRSLCCPADLNGDGAVGPADLAQLLSSWNQGGAADLTGDWIVGPADLANLLAGWGPCPQ
jgi:hypothetical protein